MKRISMLAVAVALPTMATSLPPLPEPVANNAVATVRVDDQQYLLSFNGLGSGKGYQDVHARGFGLKLGDNQWQRLPPLPDSRQGRLASVAVGVGQYAYLFGGYTVEADHSEVSLPDVYRYQPRTQQYQRLAPMPVPVDDAVAIAYQNRYIYLISGWHNDGNVNLVQLYDSHRDQWSQASPFPGKPVFGAAGALSGHSMVVCDGVKVDYFADKRRKFSDEAACYRGEIDVDNPNRIDWRVLPHPDGNSHYRMAAVAGHQGQQLWFIGGSDNPYNYDGIGYNGQPSAASARIARFDVGANQWLEPLKMNRAVMDLRGAVDVAGRWYLLGGMGANQTVLADITPVKE
ncbi:Kelch repeat-containing protein [Ferrimonas senticii]|uniref:Kelch repeat-containing protein n=1 Tax=Ferrimonas senticii TaxID=394566 RepID=UPI00040B36A0|nr:galactose oxidase [Ferrimonas senticii]